MEMATLRKNSGNWRANGRPNASGNGDSVMNGKKKDVDATKMSQDHGRSCDGDDTKGKIQGELKLAHATQRVNSAILHA